MYINIDSNKYKDMTLASLHMGLIADRFKKRQSIKDLTIKEIIESVGNNGQAFCRALLVKPAPFSAEPMLSALELFYFYLFSICIQL